MTTIDIYSGFLGAGKTTLIKKMIREAYQGEKIVLIENEFGEIGIDGGFMQDAGIQVNEMNSGCICCSLVGDFGRALKQVISDYHPDRILIEPSGVGKLSDVIGAVERVADESVTLGSFITVADADGVVLILGLVAAAAAGGQRQHHDHGAEQSSEFLDVHVFSPPKCKFRQRKKPHSRLCSLVKTGPGSLRWFWYDRSTNDYYPR